jgi:DNA-binding CsgD family transcriptional regulator
MLCRPFIGRLEELAYLRERRLDAGSSRGGLVLIAGDAGVGKTRLITEFCGALAYSRWRIGRAPCLEFASRPYGPILEVLAGLDQSPLGIGSAATKRERLDAIADRFAAVAARKALIVVIEDVHWADAATLDFLAYLAPKLQRLRLLLIASFRPDDLHPEHPATAAIARMGSNASTGRIDLAPLRGVELRTFIDEALSGTPLPDETRRAIALTGEGNPFFTEELLKSAVEHGSMVPTGSMKDRLPQSVRIAVSERLRPFDDGERRILTQAAVIGRSFALALLSQTLDTEPWRVLPTLRRARDFQLVEELDGDRFRFRHALTRDAIYASFLGAELRPRHRSIALLLENTPAEPLALEALAYHWWGAGDETKAAHYNELAGDAAARVHAHEDAIAFYERALEQPPADSVARGTIVQKIADCRVSVSLGEEALTTYNAAAAIFRDARAFDREAACRVLAAIAAQVLGLPAPTQPLEEMLERLPSEEFLASSRLHLGLAWIAATLWFPTQAESHLRQVDPRARAVAPDVNLRCHNIAAWVAMTFGDVARFREEHAAWLEAARARGAPVAVAAAHSNGAMCYSFFALHEEALHHIECSFAIARESRSPYIEDGTNAVAALCYFMMGDLRRARVAVESVPTTAESKFTWSFASAWGTAIGCRLDDRALIVKWFDGFEAPVVAAPEAENGAPFAEVMVRRGHQADAAQLLHRAIPECERLRGNVLTLLAAARHGNVADRLRAREYLARGSEGSADLIERPALTLFDAIVCSRDGRFEEAAALALSTVEAFRRLRLPLLEAEAREVGGDVEGALAVFRRCGARYDVRRLEGARPIALSAREREVAELAAIGKANLDIARHLSVHHKTVEKHLASIYLKLGISSRRQISTALGKTGGAD